MGEDGGAHVSLWTGHAALKQCLLQNETARHREHCKIEWEAKKAERRQRDDEQNEAPPHRASSYV